MTSQAKVFIPRTTAPKVTDQDWVHYTKGGNNYCLLIDGTSVLPNCVGYAWGRWREILNAHHLLCKGNAENWFAYPDRYERGQTPKLGAIACWSKGRVNYGPDGAGHVAVVEDILEDGSILTSNSAYLGSRFYMRTIKAPYNIGSAYTFQGFIYPDKEFVAGSKHKPHKPLDTIASEVILGKWGIGADRKARLTLAGYDYKAVQTRVNQLINNKTLAYPTTLTDIAKEVIAGKLGNEPERSKQLSHNGYDPKAVQIRVNQILATSLPKKSNSEIAKEVIAGEWGNGADRKKRLEMAGYEYRAIQLAVNKLLK